MKNRDEHYHYVKKWFDKADGRDIRGIDTKYGHTLYSNYLLHQLNIPYNATVLEVGCGDGVIMNRMAELRPDIKFFGVDISEHMIEKAKQLNPQFNFYVANIADEIPFNKTFDRIFSFSVGQYLLKEDLAKLCLSCLKHINNIGSIHHCAIPDIQRRLPWLINSLLDTHSPLISLLFGCFKYIINHSNKYYDDGSYWHSYEKIKSCILLGNNQKELIVNIQKPSLSWFRFDIVLKLDTD